MGFSPADLTLEAGVRRYGADFAKNYIGPLQPSDSRGGWWPMVREPFTGAWQKNAEITFDSQVAYAAVFACITLIANDFGKLRPRIMELEDSGVWMERNVPAFSPVLNKPNRFQNHIQFKEWWALSKLTRGNTYALKQRDARGVVTALYLLDPLYVRPMVAPDGAIYYQLGRNLLAGVNDSDAEQAMVPASEIIHDRINCIFHPLVGIAPLFACGLAAAQGLSIQQQQGTFFANGARPSGVLTAPGSIGDETAKRLKTSWETNFSGANSGRVAVLGDGLKYEPMVMTSIDAQLIEQLKLTNEMICSAFHVPTFKVGIGTIPGNQSAEMLNQIYYADCLQSHVEQFELCMDEGLGIGFGQTTTTGKTLGVDLDLEALTRMDARGQIDMLKSAVDGGLISTNEARAKLGKQGVEGGDSIWRQQQDFSIAALAKRDSRDPFLKPAPSPSPQTANQPPPDQTDKMIAALLRRAPESYAHV